MARITPYSLLRTVNGRETARDPTKGVQSPTRKSIAAHAPMMCGIIDMEKGESVRWITQKRTSMIATRTR
jgi:hypothetical protein